MSEAAGLLQESIGAFDVGMSYRDSRQHEIGSHHAFEHGRGVDHRKAVANHGFRLLQATLLVANLGDQGGGQCSGGRLRSNVLLALAQRFKEIALGHVQAQLLELHQPLKTDAVHMR